METHAKCSPSKPAVKMYPCDQVCLTRSLNHAQIRACQCHDDLQVRARERWRRCPFEEMKMDGYSSLRDFEKLSTQKTTTYRQHGKSTYNSRYLLMFPYKRAKLMNKFLFPFLSDGYLGNQEKETEKSMTNMADLDNFRSVTGIAFMSSVRNLYMVSYRKLFSFSLETKVPKRLKFKPSGLSLMISADDYNRLIVFDMDLRGRTKRCIFKAAPGGENLSTVLCGLDVLQSFSLDPPARMIYFSTQTVVYEITYKSGAFPAKIFKSRSLFFLVYFKRSDEVIYSSENRVLFMSVSTKKLKRKQSFVSKPTSLVVRKDLLFISLANGRLKIYDLQQRKLLSKMKEGTENVKYLLCIVDYM